jgi:hypothetical protein
MAWRARWLRCAVAAIPACADSEPGAASESMPELGTRCADLDLEWCGPDGNPQRCIDGHWAAEDCEAECTFDGREWIGCLRIAELAWCDCEIPATEPSSACLDAQTLRLCADSCAEHACEDVCVAADPASTALGCFATNDGSASCLCLPAATPCDGSEAPRCDGEASLAVCEDGVWSLQSCDVLCAPTYSTGCLLETDGSASCHCVSG